MNLKYLVIVIGIFVVGGGVLIYFQLQSSEKNYSGEAMKNEEGENIEIQTNEHEELRNAFISPKGREEWIMGNSYEIEWILNDIMYEGALLSLVYNDEYFSQAAHIPSSDSGRSTWKISTDLFEGDYRIRLFGEKIGSHQGGGYDYKTFLSEPIRIKSKTSTNIATALESSKTKVLGTNIGIAILDGWTDPVIAIFSSNYESEVLKTITHKEIEEKYMSVNHFFQEEPIFAIRQVLYNEPLKEFLLLVEVLPYEGGSGKFAEWNFFTFDEDDTILRAVGSTPMVPESGVIEGSAVPRNITFSPDGTKIVYTTGARAGGCAWAYWPRAIDLSNFEALEISGNVPPFDLIAEMGEPTLYNIESYYYRSYKDANGVTILTHDLQWKDNNTLQGKYTAGLCYPDKEDEQFIYDFTVQVE